MVYGIWSPHFSDMEPLELSTIAQPLHPAIVNCLSNCYHNHITIVYQIVTDLLLFIK